MKAISVLIVEDNPDKLVRIIEAVEKGAGAAVVTSAETIIEAKQRVSERSYDLLVLDLSLPNYPNEKESSDAGANFLREVQDYDIYFSPKYVIGVTAYEELSEKYESSFSDRFWQLIRSDLSTINWTNLIEAFVRHIQGLLLYETNESIVDVVVVTALSDEYEALMDLPFDWSKPIALDDQVFYRLGHCRCESRAISIAAICSLKMGPIPASVLACKAMMFLKPKMFGMTGICAGVKSEVNLGDVIASSEVFSWESGKLHGGEESVFLPEPLSVSISESVLSKIQQLQADDEWIDGVKRKFMGKASSSTPKIVIGAMATGSPVVSDSEVVERIRKTNRKTVAIEMEAYGALFAARSWTPECPHLFCFKGVSDFANEVKDDSVRDYAAYMSAQLFGELLTRYGKGIIH